MRHGLICSIAFSQFLDFEIVSLPLRPKNNALCVHDSYYHYAKRTYAVILKSFTIINCGFGSGRGRNLPLCR